MDLHPDSTAFDADRLENAHKTKLRLALTRDEAAEALGIGPISLDRLARRGLIHPSRALRRPLYPVWEIVRFLRETTARLGP
jgi:hypothetical protein